MALFHDGDLVEVMSNEHGFYGSFWEATIVTRLDSTNEYEVEFKNLVKEDNTSVPLTEVVSGNKIRPVPPKIPVMRFKHGECVDVLDNDGWWSGTIAGSREGCRRYYVCFQAFKVTLEYDVSDIRIHQDWIKGTDKWVVERF